MRPRDTIYFSFLVRVWQERGSARPENAGDSAVWRFSVEDPRTGERQGFAGLSALVTFLEAQMDRRQENDPPSDAAGATGPFELGSAPPPNQSVGDDS